MCVRSVRIVLQRASDAMKRVPVSVVASMVLRIPVRMASEKKGKRGLREGHISAKARSILMLPTKVRSARLSRWSWCGF